MTFDEAYAKFRDNPNMLFEMIRDYDQLKAENAKLREIVRLFMEYTDQDRCLGCIVKSQCNDGDVDECWQLTKILRMTHELENGVSQ